MIYNTPYQDLVATRGIIRNFLECYKLEKGLTPAKKPGVFFNSISVGLQLDGFRQDLVYRKYSRTKIWQSSVEIFPDLHGPYEINLVREVIEAVLKSGVHVKKQPEEIAKALRFRLDLI